MRVLSVNVGLPREVVWRGKSITTGIYKDPAVGRLPLRSLNLDGDRQADLRVHGGPDKAVYVYPSESYELWSRERPELAFGPGVFGENLTTLGLLEEEVGVGDRFRIGTAEVVVTQPRLPCFKLGIKMGRDEFVTEFLDRGLYGFYLAVTHEGDVAAGDPIAELERDPTVCASTRSHVSTRTVVTTSRACDARPPTSHFRPAGATTSIGASTRLRHDTRAVPTSAGFAVGPLRTIRMKKAAYSRRGGRDELSAASPPESAGVRQRGSS